MKIKNSFVTNSSSTSYLVCWNKKITKKDLDYVKTYISEEKAEIVFNDSLRNFNECFKLKTKEDLKILEKKFIDSNGIMEVFDEEYIEYMKKLKEFNSLFDKLPRSPDGYIKEDCDEYILLTTEFAKLKYEHINYEYQLLDKYRSSDDYNIYLMNKETHRIQEAEKFFYKNKGKYIYEYTYGNEDIYDIDMESDETFSKLSFVEFNNH